MCTRLATPREQRQLPLDAVGADHHVDGLAHRHAGGAQCAVVARRAHGQGRTEHGHHGEHSEQAVCPEKRLLAPETLQHFGQHEITDHDGLLSERGVEPVGLRCRATVEVVDPHRQIDRDHARASRRMASRSPSQRSFPRHDLSARWRCRRTSTRRPSSTTPRLVRMQVARCAAAISFSSITILVRRASTLDVYDRAHPYTLPTEATTSRSRAPRGGPSSLGHPWLPSFLDWGQEPISFASRSARSTRSLWV